MLVRLVVVVALLALGSAGLTGCGGDPAKPAASSSPTAVADLRVGRMDLVRVRFCDLVPAAAVRAALSGRAASASSWGNGDRVPGLDADQLGHEVGCTWQGSGDTRARAWVFARPVAPGFAAKLVAAAGSAPRKQHCRVVAGPAFGKPSLTQVCSPGSTKHRARHAGLFGDTWLTCEISGKGSVAALLARADRWCAGVAGALDAG